MKERKYRIFRSCYGRKDWIEWVFRSSQKEDFFRVFIFTGYRFSATFRYFKFQEFLDSDKKEEFFCAKELLGHHKRRHF
jgi:hypothetical protein